jgi:hypothetical protein
MKGLRIYIAGPMESAGGNWNMPLFDFVANKLRSEGAEVFSPAEHIREAHGSLDTVLKMDRVARKLARRQALRDEILWIIDKTDMLLLLPGWERSPGASAERAVALAVGIEVRETGTIVLPTGGKTYEAGPDEADTGVALTRAIDDVLAEDDLTAR